MKKKSRNVHILSTRPSPHHRDAPEAERHTHPIASSRPQRGGGGGGGREGGRGELEECGARGGPQRDERRVQLREDNEVREGGAERTREGKVPTHEHLHTKDTRDDKNAHTRT